MTTYTAADFAVSRFADFDASDAIAMRSGSGRKPWVIPNGRVLSDAKMAADGWVPVREPSDLYIRTGKTCPESCEWRTRAEQSRPLTPDAITKEMVLNALVAYHDIAGRQARTVDWTWSQIDSMDRALRAALTEPPKRPEGAKLIDALLFDMGVDEKRDEVADYIAARLNVSPKEHR